MMSVHVSRPRAACPEQTGRKFIKKIIFYGISAGIFESIYKKKGYNLLPLLPSGPGGVQRELVV